MKKNLLLIILLCNMIDKANAQSLPANTCGVVYTYDAAGNRTNRSYLCNNSLSYFQAPVMLDSTATIIQQVAQLHPNPSTGRFTVSFAKALKNATVILLDMTGSVLQQSKRSGNQIQFDISPYAPGVYVVKVIDGNNQFSFKVIKQYGYEN